MTGLIWATWRRQRALALAGPVILAGFVVAAALENHDVWFPGASMSRSLAAYLPAALGLFWGAPLLAREFEDGTVELLWTQTVSRTKWLAYTLAIVLPATVVVAVGVRVLLPWAFGTRFPLAYTYEVLSAGAVGYAVFAVALGVFVGAVFGRVEPAMGVTLVGYALTRYVFGLVEQRHVRLQRIVIPRDEAREFYRHVIPHGFVVRKNDVIVTYQSASDLARLQWLELGLFCGLAAVLLAGAFGVTARRSSR